jgi:prepilin-type N-terminal cleavage/methylation domain-containing protein
MNKREQGFTLIEIAIVLVIIGLLLGGVLKGQELITGARVRNLIGQQDGVKAAYFGFLDRYRALPGDYKNALTNIQNTTKNGDGDGQIELTNGTDKENNLVWEHLAKAGFINGSYTYNATVSEATNPMNPFGAFIELIHDDVYGGSGSAVRPNLKTGSRIPVEILAEVDRKVDDGLPDTGSFRSSAFGSADTCVTTATPPAWDASSGKSNCGGATLF